MGQYARGRKKPRDFAWAKLGKKRPLYSDEFEIYLVQVKSDSPAGRALHVDPIAFFEKNIKEMGLRKRSTLARWCSGSMRNSPRTRSTAASCG